MSIVQKQGEFVCDSSNSDHGLEALLDFEISWILRLCEKSRGENEKRPKLFYQCNVILRKLLDLKNTDYVVKSVKVWKQWEKIDVLAEILIEIDGKEQWHILTIEDKAYTMMKENQRDAYPEIVKQYYDADDKFKGYNLHLCVISLFDKDDPNFNSLREFALAGKNFRWNVFSAEELPDWKVEDVTESDIFNEFWLVSWQIV